MLQVLKRHQVSSADAHTIVVCLGWLPNPHSVCCLQDNISWYIMGTDTNTGNCNLYQSILQQQHIREGGWVAA